VEKRREGIIPRWKNDGRELFLGVKNNGREKFCIPSIYNEHESKYLGTEVPMLTSMCYS